ncbi:RNA polymerase sigma factor [bacterium]|nr:RNA polymerase sigma factor [bacterium]
MDDRTLVQLFTQGHGYERQKAFTEIVNGHRERLYYVIKGFVNDHDDTDDILQEVFLKAYQHLHNFEGKSSLYTWLCRIAINLSITHLRKKKIRNFLSLDTLINPPEAQQSLPDQIADANELRKVIQKAVESLPEKQKKVFILRYYDELSNGEIATIIGKSEGAVKANFFHAVNKIKKYIEKHLKDGYGNQT